MKLPRDLSGEALSKRLERLGYTVERQTGSHLRLVTTANGEHHITVPNHDCLKVGTLSAILNDVANHAGISRQELLEVLFEK